MASTKESKARSKVHAKLPKRQFSGPFWWQSMSGTGTGGTPDHYYDGPWMDLWVEWKWTDSDSPRTLPDLTDLQEKWLERRYRNGDNVAVIQCSPTGCRIYPGLDWKFADIAKPVDNAECAAYIERVTHNA